MGTQTIMWCFISHWSRRESRLIQSIKTLLPLNLIPLLPHSLFLATFFFLLVNFFFLSDPMKEITDSVDPRIMFKHQSLLQDYHELRKETEFTMRKLEMMKQRRSTLDAEVRFLRRKYKHLKQDQTLEASSKMLRLSESGDLKMPIKRKKDALALLDNNNPKRSRGNEVLTNSTRLPDLNGDVSTDKAPGFDLNQISREDEEPEANGGHVVSEATKNGMIGNVIDDLHGGMKLPICRDVDKELNKAAVKRKVSWQDPVALSVRVIK